jgi:hypothetical protein
MKLDKIVAAAVYMVLNVPTDENENVVDRAVALVKEVLDHVEDDEIGRLIAAAVRGD